MNRLMKNGACIAGLIWVWTIIIGFVLPAVMSNEILSGGMTITAVFLVVILAFCATFYLLESLWTRKK